jgi:Mrp family chromosome partitioning ATPase
MPDDNKKELDELQVRIKRNMFRIKNKFIVISGKGGVGKTSVAVNLAYGLALKGYSIGIMDTDIHGPNIAKMLGVEGKQFTWKDSLIEPIEVLPNLKAVSVAFLDKDPDSPMIWRGPLKMGLIRQFLGDVEWGDLDYFIVDSPPGTGDEPLSVCQLIPDMDGAIVVTTPQDVAVMDARKSIVFAGALKVPVVGVIENMSGFTCPKCGEKINLFKTGGGEKAAQDLGVPFLGRIPIEPDMVEFADAGKPYVHFKKETQTARSINDIIDKIIKFKKTGI